MSAERPPGRLVLVTGQPGADPHEVARAVAALLERAVHVDLEALQEVVVTGAVRLTAPWGQSGAPEPEALEQVFLRWLAGIAVGETYQRGGFDAVLSERVSGDLLDDLLDFVDPTPVHLVVLRADDGGAEHESIGLRIDPRDETPRQTAGTVLERLDQALIG